MRLWRITAMPSGVLRTPSACFVIVHAPKRSGRCLEGKCANCGIAMGMRALMPSPALATSAPPRARRTGQSVTPARRQPCQVSRALPRGARAPASSRAGERATQPNGRCGGGEWRVVGEAGRIGGTLGRRAGGRRQGEWSYRVQDVQGAKRREAAAVNGSEQLRVCGSEERRPGMCEEGVMLAVISCRNEDQHERVGVSVLRVCFP